MLSSLVLLTFAAAAVDAVPSPFNLERYKRSDGGFSIPAAKRNLGQPLRKRVNEVAINERWWITLGIGTPAQDLNFLPDSGANDFSMQSTLLPQDQRGNGLFFDPSKSTTAKQMSGYTYSEAFGSGYSDSGVVYTDTITFGDGVFKSVPILLTNKVSEVSNYDRCGNLGIDPDTGGQSTSPKRVPTFMQSIRSSLSKGVIALNYNTYTQTGTMDVGFIDTAKYTGNLTYVKKQADSTEWTVTFDGMVIGGTTKKLPFTAIVDSGTGSANIPRANLDAFFAQVPSATWNADANTYVYPCNANLPDMVFSYGGLALRIPPPSWRGNPINGGTTTCACGFTAGDGFLGEVFIEGAYTVFDFDNMQVGFANKPAQSTTIPTLPTSGSTQFCTGTSKSGTCSVLNWPSNECQSLQSTTFYHNVGSFYPNRGGCTLYSDTKCTTPLSDQKNIHSTGQANAGTSGKSAGSFMCLYPTDYPATGSGFMQTCSDIGFKGTCNFLDWDSYACNTLPAGVAKNVSSAGPNVGYCYWYTDTGCTVAVQNGAPMPWPGTQRLTYGKVVQSFMCFGFSS